MWYFCTRRDSRREGNDMVVSFISHLLGKNKEKESKVNKERIKRIYWAYDFHYH